MLILVQQFFYWVVQPTTKIPQPKFYSRMVFFFVFSGLCCWCLGSAVQKSASSKSQLAKWVFFVSFILLLLTYKKQYGAFFPATLTIFFSLFELFTNKKPSNETKKKVQWMPHFLTPYDICNTYRNFMLAHFSLLFVYFRCEVLCVCLECVSLVFGMLFFIVFNANKIGI